MLERGTSVRVAVRLSTCQNTTVPKIDYLVMGREGKVLTISTTSAARIPPIEWPTRMISVVGDSWGTSHSLKLSRASSMAR